MKALWTIITGFVGGYKEYLYAALIVAFIWSGYWMRGVYDDHMRVAEIEARDKKIAELQKTANKYSADLEIERAKHKDDNRKTHNQLEIARAKTPAPDCALSIDELQALHQ